MGVNAKETENDIRLFNGFPESYPGKTMLRNGVFHYVGIRIFHSTDPFAVIPRRP